MKTLAIRAFVVALAVAGFSASSMYSASMARAGQAKVLVAHPHGIMPGCDPTSSCGIK
ncbi:MAG: hypothetical protein ACLGQX_05455 [Acidobacteriota bacterium]